MELAQRAIAATTAEIVLDPFIGSGTTAVAALLEGRQYVGIDLSEEYCRLAQERVARVEAKLDSSPQAAQQPETPSALEVREMLIGTAEQWGVTVWP